MENEQPLIEEDLLTIKMDYSKYCKRWEGWGFTIARKVKLSNGDEFLATTGDEEKGETDIDVWVKVKGIVTDISIVEYFMNHDTEIIRRLPTSLHITHVGSITVFWFDPPE